MRPVEVSTMIVRTRNRAGLSQQQFAQLLGVPQQTLSDWEHGRSQRTLMAALRLAKLMQKQKN